LRGRDGHCTEQRKNAQSERTPLNLRRHHLPRKLRCPGHATAADAQCRQEEHCRRREGEETQQRPGRQPHGQHDYGGYEKEQHVRVLFVFVCTCFLNFSSAAAGE
jgi:hypothetical protein